MIATYVLSSSSLYKYQREMISEISLPEGISLDASYELDLQCRLN